MSTKPKLVPRVRPPAQSKMLSDAQAVALFRLEKLPVDHPKWSQALADASVETLRKLKMRGGLFKERVDARLAELEARG